jgi:hypothetical protein
MTPVESPGAKLYWRDVVAALSGARPCGALAAAPPTTVTPAAAAACLATTTDAGAAAGTAGLDATASASDAAGTAGLNVTTSASISPAAFALKPFAAHCSEGRILRDGSGWQGGRDVLSSERRYKGVERRGGESAILNALHDLRCYQGACRLQRRVHGDAFIELEHDHANNGCVCYDLEARGFAVSPWLHN